ncbi:Flagellar secretion chaperone FliSB [Gammaproteobacteria bacterium]
MNRMINRSALQQYQQIGVQSSIVDASPHRLIQMLFEGALDRIAKARGSVVRGEVAEKCRYIGAAMAIVDGLAGSLNLEAGGEIANNLAALYDYMGRRLLQANIESSALILDEVSSLLGQVKEGWDAISVETTPTTLPPTTSTTRPNRY